VHIVFYHSLQSIVISNTSYSDQSLKEWKRLVNSDSYTLYSNVQWHFSSLASTNITITGNCRGDQGILISCQSLVTIQSRVDDAPVLAKHTMWCEQVTWMWDLNDLLWSLAVNFLMGTSTSHPSTSTSTKYPISGIYAIPEPNSEFWVMSLLWL